MPVDTETKLTMMAGESQMPDLEIHAPPWGRNPSSWSQRIPICILAFVGFLISSYLALFEWHIINSVWDPVFGDQTRQVLESNVARTLHRWFGIPDAALGAIAYLGDAIFGLAGSTRRWQYRPWLVIVFGFDVIPLGFVSAILVFLQGAMVQAWCFLCLVTAIISLVLIIMAYDEVWSSLLYLRSVWCKFRSPRQLWAAFIGKPSQELAEFSEEWVKNENRYEALCGRERLRLCSDFG